MRYGYFAGLACSLALAGCGDDGATNDDGDADAGVDAGSSDVTHDVGADTFGDAAAADDAADADGEPDGRPYFPEGGYVLEDSHVNVVTQITFLGAEDGVVDGFDLDGVTSVAGDGTGCGRPDMTSPDGVAGIDNSFGGIWPALEPLVGTQLQGLLQGAINEGRVLIMMEMAGVDDIYNDDDVTVNVYRALGDPEVGTFGFISPNQTYEMDYGSPISVVEGVAIEDGHVVAGPFSVSIPIDILDFQAVLAVEGAFVDLQIDERGHVSGTLGGAFSVDDFLDELMATGGRAEGELIEPFLRNSADITFDERECGHLSVAVRVEGTKAYVVRDPEQQ